MRTFITASEVGGNSVFRFEQFPAFVTAPGDPDRPSDVSSERTLTLYETPLDEARQLLIDHPAYYAALVGLASAEEVGENGFGPINETLACQEVSDPDIANVPQPPETPAAPPPETPPAPTTTLADLPNGNYRLASADYPFRVVTDEELLENGGILFLFRKFGDSVTGNFGYIDSEIGACIAGTLEGNTVTGEAYTDDEPTVADDGETYLGPGLALILGENAGGDRYDGSILRLGDFSRINAGTVLPPESCQ